jgi:hypothetical protein
MPRIPRQLFDDVCQIRVAGVPGPVFRGLLEAFEQFVKVVLFVLFVFIIVLTFGAVYKVSSTNQMLATLVGGFLPMMLKTFLAPPNPDVEVGTVSFKSKLDEVIKNFCQKWPMYDFPFQVVQEEKEPEKSTEDDATAAPNSEEPAPSSPNSTTYRPPTFVDCMAVFARADGDNGYGATEMYNNNTSDYSESRADEPKSPTVEKCVRIAEKLEDDEVDILIYLPDKYDDVWLDEWSDILSRTSKTQVNAA